MDKVKYFIGPMSKNIVDTIIEYSQETQNLIGFVPSRRQVDYNRGYVNNWNTNEFSKYVDNKILLKRDHAGPGQGYTSDSGFRSLEEDCKFFDLIHIDPWKKYPEYDKGLDWTIDMINFCFKSNPKLQFEIGTEEAIRRFEPEELDKFIKDLQNKLNYNTFNQIKYIVVQSGTSLEGNTNTGTYNKNRLVSMLEVAKKYGLLSKEHNVDYIPSSLIKEKMQLGLDSINIAPEFGLIETNTYLDNEIDIEKFWKICYDSNRWVKWVSEDFNPIINKIELIKICGHYVFSDPQFLDIKPDLDSLIKLNIKNKLNEFFG